MEALSKLFHFNKTQGFHCVVLHCCNGLCYEIQNLFLPPLKKKNHLSSGAFPFSVFLFSLFCYFELQLPPPCNCQQLGEKLILS